MAEAYSVICGRDRIDLAYVHDYLSTKTYWAQGRSLETVRLSIDNSLCFGVFSPEGRQVGFARVVTDRATFAWLCDVFIDEAHRGKGLGKTLVATIVAHPELRGLRRFILATRDAHDLYRNYGGFESLANPERWMQQNPG